MQFSIVFARLCCLEGRQGLEKVAAPLRWGNRHDGPYRAHLGEQQESRLKEQVPRESYRIDLNSSIPVSHTSFTSWTGILT